jgi:hypothetical protein
MTYNQLKTIDNKIADWRKKSAEQKRTVWRSDLVSRVQDSMAMENEPVSEKWVKQAKHR